MALATRPKVSAQTCNGPVCGKTDSHQTEKEGKIYDKKSTTRVWQHLSDIKPLSICRRQTQCRHTVIMLT